MAQSQSLPMYLTVAVAVLLLIDQSRSELATVPLPRNLQCPPSQVFDSTGLVCSDSNGRCPPSSLQTHVECSIDELWKGSCNEISCSSMCTDMSQVASLSQQHCMKCSAEANSLYEPSEYDATSNECTCNNPSKGAPSGTHVVTKRLVEVDGDFQACQVCPEGTAVITKELYDDGQQYFTTAGKKYTADPYTCASCPDPKMFFASDYTCVCMDGYYLTGEASVGEQSCIKNNPSIASSYSIVRFRDPPFILGGQTNDAFDFTLDSITFAHIYLKAAAECEYYRGSSESLQSCQALGNLCVMSMYDEDSPSCKQYSTILQRRVDTYHGQENWKHTLPWLRYSDDADYITNDRGINMKISFHPEVNHVNILRFKLAKYAINGTFVGMEDLTNQFEFCFNSLGKDDQSHPQWLAFGMSYRHEYSCSIPSMLEKEMFLYDMYIVDESSESCNDNSDCLYPVPVLNRNYAKDNKYLNINRQLGDELDDEYTRRFFLFDNQSGRTSSGTQAVRYAKKIVLQIQTQTENRSKLYPPRLIIEYATASSGSWSGEKDLVFKVEYSMKTEDFWASIHIMTGFIFAFAVVIFGIRMNNWQSRQRTNSDDPTLDGSILGLHFLLHAFLIACHTFVLLFFSFTFMICAYWFIFFKLQNEVFLLLPADNEFYGATNEYYFFEVSFRALFWCQTIYVAYTLARQCRSDIIFVDWEQPWHDKTSKSVPSMWRLHTVANEFNRMQSKRQSSIEFSLIFVSFVMLGLGQHKNSQPQPNFHQTEYENSNNNNIALGFANTVLYWALAAAIQWLWRFLIYERYIKESAAMKFVDLCTVCNISVFIMMENHKGYYLHCKSPYHSADCSIEQLLKNLQREGNGMMIERGLGGTSNQTFDFFASPAFRLQLSKIYSYARPRQDRFFSQDNNDQPRDYDEEKIGLARAQLTNFLQGFIDQGQWIIREPWMAEKLLHVTPAETRAEPKCVLLPDNYGFLAATFLGLGAEIDLLIHDILTYNALNMAFHNVAVSIFATYAMHLCRTFLRSWFGRKNLSESSMIDSRFLG